MRVFPIVPMASGMAQLVLKLSLPLHPSANLALSILLIDLHCPQAVLFWLVFPG